MANYSSRSYFGFDREEHSPSASDRNEQDEYAAIAARFGLTTEQDAPTRRVGHKQGKAKANVAASLADPSSSLDERFEITYAPARYEAVWLTDSLRPFAERALLQDVLALVKGGKEANVYLCEAVPATGNGLMAAKVYRPRQFRNLRNDKMYREGRELLNSAGAILHNRDTREMRAIGKKTAFGQELTHISWLMHEYATLTRLHGAGAATPRPIAAGENAILMEYVGDRRRPAPVLHTVSLHPAEARRLFDEVMRNVALMLSLGMIHGDLSAYNILYWQGGVTLIDFPQVTFAEANSNAWPILRRDVERICDYFATQGVEADAHALADELWNCHVRLPQTPLR